VRDLPNLQAKAGAAKDWWVNRSFQGKKKPRYQVFFRDFAPIPARFRLDLTKGSGQHVARPAVPWQPEFLHRRLVMVRTWDLSRGVAATAVVAVLSLVAGQCEAEEFSADFSQGRLISDMHVELNACDFNPDYGGSLRMLYRNASYLKAQFYAWGNPGRGLLLLDHQSSIDENAPRRGTSPITIEVNGVKAWRNFDLEHGYHLDRFNISRDLRPGWNTIRILYGNGTTHYWLRTMRVETE
jgi:hypothetical protein